MFGVRYPLQTSVMAIESAVTVVSVSGAKTYCGILCAPIHYAINEFQWFWLSIQLNCCANEEIYQWKGHKRANRKRAAFSSPRSEQPAHSSRRTLSRLLIRFFFESTLQHVSCTIFVV